MKRDRLVRVSVAELLRKFSLLSDKALNEPIIIAKNGRDRLVLVSVEEYLLMRDTIGCATTLDTSVLDTTDNARVVVNAPQNETG